MVICTWASKEIESDCLWSLAGLIYLFKHPSFWRKIENSQSSKNSGDTLCYALYKSYWDKILHRFFLYLELQETSLTNNTQLLLLPKMFNHIQCFQKPQKWVYNESLSKTYTVCSVYQILFKTINSITSFTTDRHWVRANSSRVKALYSRPDVR